MSNFIALREGAVLPTVGVLQKLLNARGAQLVCDGHFGPRTRGALATYQRWVNLPPTGAIDRSTFEKLFAPEGLGIADSIDVFDEAMLGDAMAVQAVGGNPLIVGGMSRGVLQVASMLRSHRNLFLLRFNGHGSPGWQGVSVGTGGVGEQRAALHIVNSKVAEQLGLRSIFGPYGSVQMHGCRVGRGPKGHQFLSHLANAFGVPVSGALDYQPMAISNPDSPFGLIGKTHTAFPKGMNIRSWCQSLPDFDGMSPMPG